jgi:hypothetical protein
MIYCYEKALAYNINFSRVGRSVRYRYRTRLIRRLGSIAVRHSRRRIASRDL